MCEASSAAPKRRRPPRFAPPSTIRALVALATYASLAVVCVASLLVGQAILAICGRREPTWLAGPVGLAAILTASGIAIKLPGHATAVAITLAILVVFSLAIARIAVASGRWGPGELPQHLQTDTSN